MKNVTLALSLIFLCAVLVLACNDYQNFKSKSSEEGFQLASIHCKTCHQFPEPGMLDKKTWAYYILPKMSGFFGFKYMDGGTYFESGYHPESMPLSDWEKIVRYYIQESPDSLEQGEKKNIDSNLRHFTSVVPQLGISSPATTFVGINDEKKVVVGDGDLQSVYLLSNEFLKQDSVNVGKGVVKVWFNDSALTKVLTMGVLHPSDERKGQLVYYNTSTKSANIILDSLQRPVYGEYAHLNSDTIEDIVICEFGNTVGQLSWFEGKGNNKYIKHVLRPLPGAVKTVVYDVDGDGRKDIMALMAQGDEGVFTYYNKGENVFKEERLLSFPPSFGSNYFELIDFNKDGYMDIVATNGDNGDYPPVLKPYHGIRIYLNDGKNRFKETVFLPMNGVGKAMAKDFDEDGDLDLASIAYFPDFKETLHESFLYWENKGDWNFRPCSLKEATLGRWLTMESGDIDQDGDIDIILGNAKFTLGKVPEHLMKKWSKQSPSVLILKNTRR